MRSPPNCRGSSGTAIPIGRRPSCAQAIADCARCRRPTWCSPPTAPTRCCRRSCSPTPAPGRTVATFEPTYQMHAQIARVIGSTVVEGERAADFTLDPAEVRRVVESARPHVTFLTSPNNPTGLVEPAERIEQLLAARLRPGRRRRGVRPVRRLVGAVDARRGAPARRHPHVLEDLVDGRRPARLPDRADVVRRRTRQGRAAVPPRRGQADRRSARAAVRRRHGRTGRDDRRRARTDRRRRWRACRST